MSPRAALEEARAELAVREAELDELERQEGTLAARLQAERESHEEVRRRLESVGRAAEPLALRDVELEAVERRLELLRDELAETPR